MFAFIELPLQAMLLAMEAHAVMGLRLRKIAMGGPAAMIESSQMVTEKFVALAEVTGTLVTGGSVHTVMGRLRTQVRANETRLLG